MTIPRHRLTARDAYRQANEVALFEQHFLLGVDAQAWDSVLLTSGTVAHGSAEASARVSVTVTSGSSATLRSHARPRAAVGRARGTVLSGYLQNLDANRRVRWGAFDDNDGYFWQVTGETFAVVRRIGGTDTAVAQAAFSESTGRDWTGELTDAHVYEVRESWPTGEVLWFIDGELVHVLATAGGDFAGPAIASPRAPVSVEVVNTAGASASGYFALMGAAVLAEEAPVSVFSCGAYAYDADVGSSLKPMLTLRAAEEISSVPNTADIMPDRLTVFSGGQCRVQVLRGGTVSGASFAAAASGSVAEVDVAGTSVSSGVVVGEFVGTELDIDLARLLPRVGLLGDGTQEELTVMVANLTTGIATAVALTWREIR